MPEVRLITKDNWNELIRLKVREDQTHFVASNLYSIRSGKLSPLPLCGLLRLW